MAVRRAVLLNKLKAFSRWTSFGAWVAGVATVEQRARADSTPQAVPVATPASSTVASSNASASSGPWSCIAEAETGSDWTMHGATYSTAFGMVNAIIYEYGTQDEIAAVFSGTASAAQQIDIASRFAAQHGFSGWGVLTKQKCGLS